MLQSYEIAEALRKIEPIHPEQARKLWTLYLSAPDLITKANIETKIMLLAQKTLGFTFLKEHIYLPLPKLESIYPNNAYRLGNIKYQNKTLPFFLKEQDLLRHTAIIGTTGSGKTTLAVALLKNLASRKTPFLIFDWKRSYRHLIFNKNLNIKLMPLARPHLGKLQFNPLIPPPGTSIQTWVKQIADVLCQAFFIGEGVQYLFSSILDVILKKYHISDSSPDTAKFPTLKEVLIYVKAMKLTSRQKLWQDSLCRVLFHLTYGPIAETLCADRNDTENLLSGNVCIELDGLSENEKMFVTSAMLLWIYQYRLNQSREDEKLKHVILIEEAHNIFPKIVSSVPRITDVVFRQIRELGVGLVAISQTPSSMHHEVLANCNTLISFTLRNKTDIETAGKSLLLQQSEFDYLGKLKVGQAIVKTGSASSPFLIESFQEQGNKQYLTDFEIARRNKIDSAFSEQNIPIPHDKSKNIGIPLSAKEHHTTQEEDRLLSDIVQFELDGITVRACRLKFSARKLSALIASLEKKQYIKRVEIKLARGKTVMLASLPLDKCESIQHKFWKYKIAEKLRKETDKTTIHVEYRIGNFRIDVVGLGKGKKVAIEVETGCSDITLNLLKNLPAGFDVIVFAATNWAAYRKIKKLINDMGLNETKKISVVMARYFINR